VHAIALFGGVSPKLARYYPGLFDAVLVIACVAAAVLRDARWWARAWAWVVLVVVLAAIGATDVVHAMNYSLRQRTTEGVVAAAPVVAVLLAFSLLLTLLRQSRSHGPGAAAGDGPSDWAAQRPTMPVPLDLPALPAALPAADMANEAAVADAATVETPAMTAGPAIRPPAPPIALPAGPEKGPLTPPDGLPAMTRHSAEPKGTLAPAPPPLASQRAPEGDPAPPTVSSPAVPPVAPPPLLPPPALTAEPAPARSHAIRYAGSGASVRAGGEPSATEPGTTATEPDDPREDYWDGDDAGQFAGLVYPAREASAHPDDAAGHDSGDRPGQVADDDDRAPADDDANETSGREPAEVDEHAPPFATAPFAAVPRLNRLRSMPVPPEDEDEPQ
jgi:hypothetical protein